MQPTFKVLLNGVSIKKLPTETRAINHFKQLMTKNPALNYTVIKEEVIYTAAQAANDQKAFLLENLLANNFPRLLKKYALDPQFAKFLKQKLSKAVEQGDVIKVQKLLSSYKGSLLKKRASPILSKRMIRMCEKLFWDSVVPLHSEELDMGAYFLKDIADYLDIARALAENNYHKGYKIVHSLDTGARDQLPATVWNYFDK